ncbi:MAG TPA: metallophosphoesterase [Anaerolineales bacterium]|nr:metallophosphoesterase [Anaerolineales bacterium]
MRILAVSDQTVERFYELIPQGHFDGTSMVLACGDLPYDYLEYMVTLLNAPVYYVPGNHDPAYSEDVAGSHAAGCVNLDLRTAEYQGVLLAGLGGSIRYRPDAVNQYTQQEAYVRASRLVPPLLNNRRRYGRALDILVTHSPPFGIQDDDSSAHTGLKAINWLLGWARPNLHVHGHLHRRVRNLEPAADWMGPTAIMNVFPHRMIEFPYARLPER